MFWVAQESKEFKYSGMTGFAQETQAEAYAKVIEMDAKYPEQVHWTVWM